MKFKKAPSTTTMFWIVVAVVVVIGAWWWWAVHRRRRRRRVERMTTTQYAQISGDAASKTEHDLHQLVGVSLEDAKDWCSKEDKCQGFIHVPSNPSIFYFKSIMDTSKPNTVNPYPGTMTYCKGASCPDPPSFPGGTVVGGGGPERPGGGDVADGALFTPQTPIKLPDPKESITITSCEQDKGIEGGTKFTGIEEDECRNKCWLEQTCRGSTWRNMVAPTQSECYLHADVMSLSTLPGAKYCPKSIPNPGSKGIIPTGGAIPSNPGVPVETLMKESNWYHDLLKGDVGTSWDANVRKYVEWSDGAKEFKNPNPHTHGTLKTNVYFNNLTSFPGLHTLGGCYGLSKRNGQCKVAWARDNDKKEDMGTCYKCEATCNIPTNITKSGVYTVYHDFAGADGTCPGVVGGSGSGSGSDSSGGSDRTNGSGSSSVAINPGESKEGHVIDDSKHSNQKITPPTNTPAVNDKQSCDTLCSRTQDCTHASFEPPNTCTLYNIPDNGQPWLKPSAEGSGVSRKQQEQPAVEQNQPDNVVLDIYMENHDIVLHPPNQIIEKSIANDVQHCKDICQYTWPIEGENKRVNQCNAWTYDKNAKTCTIYEGTGFKAKPDVQKISGFGGDFIPRGDSMNLVIPPYEEPRKDIGWLIGEVFDLVDVGRDALLDAL